MVAAKDNPRRQREYILVKNKTTFYYARVSRNNPDMYVVMTDVSEKEGRDIIEKANGASEYKIQEERTPSEENNPLG